jgi:bacteriocin biosynthesis cyclodehydratase domain-containing protein
VLLAPAAGDPLPEPPRLPHLVAEVREDVGVVGPFVQPGRTACLRCLDLTRTDRDPDWPVVALQLAAGTGGAVACDSALALAVAAQATVQALTLLDGDDLPAAAGGTLELTLPDWRWRRRSWQLHPDCDCHAPFRAVTGRGRAAQATLEA